MNLYLNEQALEIDRQWQEKIRQEELIAADKKHQDYVDMQYKIYSLIEEQNTYLKRIAEALEKK